MKSLKTKIINKESGIIFYGLTPPKINTEEERLHRIAAKQIERLENIDIDGLILYDLQDESARIDKARPFPFVPTLSPDIYAEQFLNELNIPKIIYKSVGKFTEEEFKEWINKNKHEYIVLVGSPSRNYNSGISLDEGYRIRSEYNNPALLGGVIIPERHKKKRNEHLRVYSKADKGCQFFISQCVYDLNGAKDFLSDYCYYREQNDRDIYPMIFSLTPCGSVKTLEFMKWLGIEIPRWLENDLQYSNDILSNSIQACKNIASELIEYSYNKNIPIGFNIESVAIRKEEVDASIELLKWLRKLYI